MNENYYENHAKPLGHSPISEDRLPAIIAEKLDVAPVSLVIFTGEAKLALTTDLLGELEGEERLSHLLEIRAFGESAELHAVRSAMGEGFAGRFIEDDEALGELDHLDDLQFLDIASNKGGHCATIGGGAFDLPPGHESATKIIIRNYIDYDSDGLAQVVDFRIVGLELSGSYPVEEE